MRTTFNLFNELSNIFNGTIAELQQSQPEKNYQLFSTPEGWVSRIDLPGYEKTDLQIQYKDEALTLTANNEIRGEKTIRYALGDEVNIDAISAKLENGVLEISLPKKEEALPTSHQIEIQ